MLVTIIFSFFHNVFYPMMGIFHVSSKFNLSSVNIYNALKFDQSKVLFFGKR